MFALPRKSIGKAEVGRWDEVLDVFVEVGLLSRKQCLEGDALGLQGVDDGKELDDFGARAVGDQDHSSIGL